MDTLDVNIEHDDVWVKELIKTVTDKINKDMPINLEDDSIPQYIIRITIHDNMSKDEVKKELEDYFNTESEQFVEWYWTQALKLKPAPAAVVAPDTSSQLMKTALSQAVSSVKSKPVSKDLESKPDSKVEERWKRFGKPIAIVDQKEDVFSRLRKRDEKGESKEVNLIDLDLEKVIENEKRWEMGVKRTKQEEF